MSEQEWRLVPKASTQAMRDAMADVFPDGDLYRAALSAAPPMPRAVFDAMVERAARAIALGDYDALPDRHDPLLSMPSKQQLREAAEAAIRAAMPSLCVEGDDQP